MKILLLLCTLIFLADADLDMKVPQEARLAAPGGAGDDDEHRHEFEEEHFPSMIGMPKEVSVNLDLDLSNPDDNFYALINIFINMTDVVHGRSNYITIIFWGEIAAQNLEEGRQKVLEQKQVDIRVCDELYRNLSNNWLILRMTNCSRAMETGMLNMTFEGIVNEPKEDYSSFNVTIESTAPGQVEWQEITSDSAYSTISPITTFSPVSTISTATTVSPTSTTSPTTTTTTTTSSTST